MLIKNYKSKQQLLGGLGRGGPAGLRACAHVCMYVCARACVCVCVWCVCVPKSRAHDLARLPASSPRLGKARALLVGCSAEPAKPMTTLTQSPGESQVVLTAPRLAGLRSILSPAGGEVRVLLAHRAAWTEKVTSRQTCRFFFLFSLFSLVLCYGYQKYFH